MLFLPLLHLLLLVLASASEDPSKRTEDSSKTSVRGGGRIDDIDKFNIRRDVDADSDGNQALLLQVEATADANAEAYSLLLDEKYAQCYENDVKGQGTFCNSCWAFAMKNMMHARRCKAVLNANRPWVASEKLSPLNMICAMQSNGFCATRGMGESLQFANVTGLAKKTWLDEILRGLKPAVIAENLDAAALGERRRLASPNLGGVIIFEALMKKIEESPRLMAWAKKLLPPGAFSASGAPKSVWEQRAAASTDARNNAARLGEDPEALIDVSYPVKDFCNVVFPSAASPESAAAALNSETNRVKPKSVSVGGNISPRIIKTYLTKGGPVVGMMRLTYEFQNFTGSLFNPKESLTFCRPYKEGNSNDYCSPATRSSWDAEQEAQQTTTLEDTWYIHFVTIHGWGVKKSLVSGESDIPYWIVENSWGRIYDNDPSLGNNGAGPNYDPMLQYQNDEKKKGLVNKNHFVLIANQVAGRGYLEMTSKEVYVASLAP